MLRGLRKSPRRGRAPSGNGRLRRAGLLGVDKSGAAPVGFRAIRLIFELDTEASEEQLEKLLSLTARYCVVYQTLKGNLALSIDRG